jgi:RNase P/RNase MRP subunit p30
MLDVKLKLKLYELLVNQCEDSLKEQAKELYNEIILTVEKEQALYSKKIEATTKAIEETLKKIPS